MNRILFALLFCALSVLPVQAATTLLPNGKQCFTDANGPVISGSMNMFFPATTTPKPTWQDSNQNTLNSQPIQLDANGCAVIYGIGSYRQQLFDGPVVLGVPTGNLLWDQLTTDTSAYNAVFWAGISGGTPNIITVVDTGFNGTDGTVINFTALSTNTGATTINPSSFGAISVVKDTASGPLALSGGEIVQNNIISVVYSASGNNFHLLNTAIPSPAGNTAPLCGATNLKITNDIGTPNTIMDVTANSVVMVNNAGAVINRSNVSVTVNISLGTSTTTAGGMDGESPGTSAWQYIWLIDNGAAPNALASKASGNGLTPNMPSGYTYKCRMGAASTDGSSNLYHNIQLGQNSQPIVGTNPVNLLKIVSGSAGTYSTTSPVLTGVPVRGDGLCAPLTASRITINAEDNFTGAGPNGVLAAPNTAWGGTNSGPSGSGGNIWPIWLNNLLGSYSTQASMTLESDSIAWAGAGTGSILSCFGYKDQVNAN